MDKRRFFISATPEQLQNYRLAALRSGLRARHIARDRMTGPWVKRVADLAAELSVLGIDPIAYLEKILRPPA